MRLFMIQRRVNDWPAAVAWYRDVLGLEMLIVDEPGRFALFDAGPAKLAIKGRNVNLDSAGSSDSALVFQVDDLDAERTRLASLGVEVGVAVPHPMENFRESHLADPEGNAVTLFAWGCEPGQTSAT